MAPLHTLVKATLLFFSTASAHFVLLNPPSLEGENIDEDKLANGPCGAITPDLAKNDATDFHVDGDFISVQLTHPQASWLFRGTVEETAKNNWTQLFPIVSQTGLGKLCEPAVTAPKAWIGKKGVIGVACKGEDGLLFQCAVVNFVSGSNTNPGSSCSNASITADFTSDSTLSALVGDGSDSSSTPPSSPSSSASSSPTSSATGNAAPGSLVQTDFPLGSLITVGAMVLAGVALL
ncbi:hypothetical protein B0H66DRAFT_555731 [Apodospora peruviana]|uniref:Copper acquisition factor BIM1-like domain-containing protein n=1 Tax=Apodospora peruviana TaxID=516989 RepID=A0AAE0IDA4_9PEZI|nr:hypothetical protein B0H66DRAFT_555731 [Apodospora peruviana]